MSRCDRGINYLNHFSFIPSLAGVIETSSRKLKISFGDYSTNKFHDFKRETQKTLMRHKFISVKVHDEPQAAMLTYAKNELSNHHKSGKQRREIRYETKCKDCKAVNDLK